MGIKSFILSDLAKEVQGETRGDSSVLIEGITGVDTAKSGTLVYVSEKEKLEEAEQGPGSAILHSFPRHHGKKPALLVKNGKLALAKLLLQFYSKKSGTLGIHPTAVIDPSADIDKEVSIGAYVVIGKNVKIGKGVEVGAFGFIDDEVRIGEDSILHPRVTLRQGVIVGKDCTLYEGSVIGSQGFSLATDETGKHYPILHLGSVVLEDEVEVGANVTIDRGTFGITRIGHGTQIDNLVQIAHNCDLGANCILAGLTGIAGSVLIEPGVIIGGHVGIKDHSVIGEGAIIAGGSHVWGDVPAHTQVSGAPARPHKEHLKIQALLRRLPEIFES